MNKQFTAVVVAALITGGAWTISTYAQARGQEARVGAPAFDPHDISGFWILPVDGRKVPPARLLPRITKAMLDLHARRDTHAIRWCNLPGVPFAMESGTPIDIRVGPTTIIVAPEGDPAPRYLYLGRKHVSQRVDQFATKIDVKNRGVDAVVAERDHRLGNPAERPEHRKSEFVQGLAERHRDQRLVLDDHDAIARNCDQTGRRIGRGIGGRFPVVAFHWRHVVAWD